MVRQDYKIFSQGEIANLTLKNRLVRSATCEYQMTEEGKTTNTIINVYKNLAAGGVGMIISSLMAVAEKGKGIKDQISIYLGLPGSDRTGVRFYSSSLTRSAH